MFVAPLGSAVVETPVSFVVTLSGATITAIVTIGISQAKLWVIADGTLWEETSNGGSVQLDAETDWIIPNEDADSSFDVRYINHVGDELVQWDDFSVEGTWVDISVSRQLVLITAFDGPDKTCTFDLQIRKDGGEVLATASFTLTTTRIG